MFQIDFFIQIHWSWYHDMFLMFNIQLDHYTVLPDCWITATENLVETKESFKPRPSSVEPPKTETTLLDDSEHKPEFKAYWHKAHRILRAFPQAKAKADGKIPNNHY